MKKNHDFDPDLLLKVLERAPHPLRLDDILRQTRLSRRLKREVQDELYRLAREGRLLHLRGGSWAMAASLKTLRGILAMQRSGAAFVIPSGKKEGAATRDVYIAPGALGDAWNGDLVEIALLPAGPGRAPEGRVLSVLQRNNSELTARLVREAGASLSRKDRGGSSALSRHLPEGRALARPADPRLNFDLLVDVSGLEQPPQQDELLRVRAEEKLDSPFDSPLWAAVALHSLGREDDAGVQETFTKLNHRIPTAFPDDVLAEAEQAASLPRPEEPGLVDLREISLVTIDGEDARDFDDAVFVERKAGGWRLLVAIADVSLFVRPRSALDREAKDRGNSYYFPCSVEPMLPEALSNGVCSLRPDEDRRVMAADMELDAAGRPLSSRFYSGIMRSKARLTYNAVQNFLDQDGAGKSAELPDIRPELFPMLRDAAELAEILIQRRRGQGGLDFAIPEAEFVVDAGRVVDVRNRERLFSHRLIEAFMVEANEAVATFLGRKQQPVLYRVHPAPSSEKQENLLRALRELNLDLPLPRPAKPGKEVPPEKWLPGLLRAAAGTEQAWLVDSLALRSMMQARYDPEQDIHFGLASKCYCHFTSPIRRYADLLVHRSLRHCLGLDSGGAIPAGKKLLAVAEQCNTRERAAQEAEREITRRMGCLVLRGKEGELFQGVISGVMSFGIFVQLAGKPLEGMVRVESLGDDYYEYDQDRQELRGVRSGVSFRMGNSVEVKLQDVNVGRLEINLVLAERLGPARTPGGRRPPKGREGKPFGRKQKNQRATGRKGGKRF